MTPIQFLSAVSLPLLWGCAPAAPYSLTLSVESATTGVATTVAYRVSEGATPGSAGDVLQQTSVLGSGINCVQAQSSSGTYASELVYEQARAYNVVGESEMELPLVPGEPPGAGADTWVPTPVSVLKDTRRVASWQTTLEDIVEIDPETGEATSRQDLSYVDGEITTLASYFGVAADEYLVQVTLDQLWDERVDLEPSDLTLLTKWEPEEGDVWPAVNGNSLFVFEGEEDLSLAGVQMKKAAKVAIYETGTVAPTEGAGVFESCLAIGRDQVNSTDAEIGQISLDRTFLNTGCVGSFTHVRSGTEWWWNGVLVQSEGTDTIVNITDYGFEWFVDDPDAGQCLRETSQTRDDPSARAFLEYTVTTNVLAQAVIALTE